MTGTAQRLRRAGESLQRGTRRASGRTWVERAARAGIAARGLVFALLGYLVARIAAGALGGRPTSKSASGPGVAQAVADQTGGRAVLCVLAVGLFCYALFSLLDAVLHHHEDSAAERWGNRALSVWGFLVYALFSGFCFATALSGPGRAGSSQHEDRQQQQLSARILRWPAGWLWLGLVAAVLLVIAGFLVRRAVLRTFRDPLDEPAMSRRTWHATGVLGAVGCLARAGLFALVGGFVASAAIEDDPAHGQGVDGAARQVAETLPGQVLLWVLAAGVVAFAAFVVIEARYRRI
jgi:hypothetical protein